MVSGLAILGMLGFHSPYLVASVQNTVQRMPPNAAVPPMINAGSDFILIFYHHLFSVFYWNFRVKSGRCNH